MPKSQVICLKISIRPTDDISLSSSLVDRHTAHTFPVQSCAPRLGGIFCAIYLSSHGLQTWATEFNFVWELLALLSIYSVLLDVHRELGET